MNIHGIRAVGLVFVVSCGSPDSAQTSCVQESMQANRQRIVNGEPAPEFLALSRAQVQAVVTVTTEHSLATVPAACTGFAIGPELVLTSSHCWEGGSVIVHVTEDGAVRHVVSKGVIPYPEPGALLVKLEPADFRFRDFFSVENGDPIVGQRVMAAGYGVDGDGSDGKLRFIVEEIATFDDERIGVTAHGRGGLCNGDSGAPLLARASNGTVAAMGLLLGGSESCRGTDVFLRTTAMLSWLEDSALLEAPLATCGSLSSEGRCFGVTPMWCDSGQLRSETCQPPTRCGYDTRRGGYGCVHPNEDPCAGADGLGRCEANTALTCASGQLNAVECDCGGSCGYDPSGHPGCFGAL